MNLPLGLICKLYFITGVCAQGSVLAGVWGSPGVSEFISLQVTADDDRRENQSGPGAWSVATHQVHDSVHVIVTVQDVH